MRTEWLTERCESLRAVDIRMQEMASLDLSDENKRKLLAKSKQFADWELERWTPFVSLVSDGDEVWRFTSPAESWAAFCGCASYCIVRSGTIGETLVTIRN